MTIRLTRKELCQIATTQLGRQVTRIIIAKESKHPISNDSSPLATEIIIRMEQSLLFNTNDIPSRPDMKIQVIRTLREVLHKLHDTCPGLAETKWIVDNWTRWINFVKIYNKLPTIIGNIKDDPNFVKLIC